MFKFCVENAAAKFNFENFRFVETRFFNREGN